MIRCIIRQLHLVPAICAAVAAQAVAAEAPLTREQIDAEEAAAKAIEREATQLKLATEADEKRISMYRTQIDLLTGRRREIPRTTVEERLVKRMLEGERVVLDNRADGSPLIDRRYLDLPPGHKYRLRLGMQLEELKGSYGVQCRNLVTIAHGGGHLSSSAFIGPQPFSWRDISFDIVLPADATSALSVGFANGKGRLLWGDLRIYELTEVTK